MFEATLRCSLAKALRPSSTRWNFPCGAEFSFVQRNFLSFKDQLVESGLQKDKRNYRSARKTPPGGKRPLDSKVVMFEVFGRARNHRKKFQKWSQTSFGGMVDCGIPFHITLLKVSLQTSPLVDHTRLLVCEFEDAPISQTIRIYHLISEYSLIFQDVSPSTMDPL